MTYPIHPAASVLPMMKAAELEKLAKDIKENGLQVPIVVCQGEIVDGRNRLAACEIAGVPPVYDFRDDIDDVPMWVWSLNGERRHLDSQEVKYLIWKKLHGMSDAIAAKKAAIQAEANRKRAEAAKEQPRTKDESGKTVFDTQVVVQSAQLPEPPKPKKEAKTRQAVAESAKVSPHAVARAEALQSKRPDLAEKVAAGEMKFALAKKTADKEQREAEMKRAAAEMDEKRKADIMSVCDIRHCSCAELFSSGIKPDAVITDPPYPQEFLPCFSELAEGCAKVGVPVVAVMSGQSYLPEVMERMCKHLTYRWTMAYLTPGGQAVQQWQAKVNTTWKPILIFGESLEWFGDVATSKTNDNDKRFHTWGQSESGMADLINRLTKPGQLICDPFIGGGTTAIAALATGRRFVGCDIDEEHVTRSMARVMS